MQRFLPRFYRAVDTRSELRDGTAEYNESVDLVTTAYSLSTQRNTSRICSGTLLVHSGQFCKLQQIQFLKVLTRISNILVAVIIKPLARGRV